MTLSDKNPLPAFLGAVPPRDERAARDFSRRARRGVLRNGVIVFAVGTALVPLVVLTSRHRDMRALAITVTVMIAIGVAIFGFAAYSTRLAIERALVAGVVRAGRIVRELSGSGYFARRVLVELEERTEDATHAVVALPSGAPRTLGPGAHVHVVVTKRRVVLIVAGENRPLAYAGSLLERR